MRMHARRGEESARSAGPDPSVELAGREIRAMVNDEILRLPEKQQAAAVLGLVQGMTHEAGARALGLAAGDVQDPDRRGPCHPRPAAGPARGRAGRDGRGRSIRVRHLPALRPARRPGRADARRGDDRLRPGRGRGHGRRAGAGRLPRDAPHSGHLPGPGRTRRIHSVRAGLDHRPPGGATRENGPRAGRPAGAVGILAEGRSPWRSAPQRRLDAAGHQPLSTGLAHLSHRLYARWQVPRHRRRRRQAPGLGRRDGPGDPSARPGGRRDQ